MRRFLEPAVPMSLLAALGPLLLHASAEGDPSVHLFTLSGDPGEQFGASVCGLGDVDGDGRDDWLVGAPNAGVAAPGAGRAVLVSGATGVSLREHHGTQPWERFGAALAPMGDVDGDGTPDYAVGAPGSGAVSVFDGASGRPRFVLHSAAGGDRFGAALAGLGDADGNGVPDLAVGAPHSDLAAPNAGSVTVHSGSDGAELARLEGTAPFDQLGLALGAPGDVDGDGCAEVLVGVPFDDEVAFNAGRALVWAAAKGEVLVAIAGELTGDRLGERVAGLGDVDGDGVGDLGLGAPGSDHGGIDAGEVRVHSGADGALLLRVPGESAGEFSAEVAGAGDTDGDGLGEVLVGSPSGGTGEAGRVRLVSPASGAVLQELQGSAAGAWFGAALAGLGDVNGDGCADVVAGAPGHDDDPSIAGTVRVVSSCGLGLAADVHTIPIAVGGTQSFSLDAGPEHGGSLYWVLGSLSGTEPGLSLGSGVLPLVPDPWFQATLATPNQGPLVDTLGTLDPLGRANAAFVLSAGVVSVAAPLPVHHAFVVVDGGVVTPASTAVPCTLHP